MLPPLGHVKIIYDFTSFLCKTITKKLNGTSRAEIILHVTMTSVLLGHMTSTYGFVFTFMSSITTEFSMTGGQHTPVYFAFDDNVSVSRSRD